MSGGCNQTEREESRASSKWAEDVIRETGKGSAMQREQREHTQRLRGLNKEAVSREGC